MNTTLYLNIIIILFKFVVHRYSLYAIYVRTLELSMLARHCYPSSKSNGMFALKTNTPFGCDHQPSPFPPFTLSCSSARNYP